MDELYRKGYIVKTDDNNFNYKTFVLTDPAYSQIVNCPVLYQYTSNNICQYYSCKRVIRFGLYRIRNRKQKGIKSWMNYYPVSLNF
jgi:hypothetical protein